MDLVTEDHYSVYVCVLMFTVLGLLVHKKSHNSERQLAAEDNAVPLRDEKRRAMNVSTVA